MKILTTKELKRVRNEVTGNRSPDWALGRVWDQMGNQVKNRIWYQIRDEVKIQTEDQLFKQSWDQARDRVGSFVYEKFAN